MNTARIAVAQCGARKHYQEPLLFHRWGILEELYTDFYSGHSQVVNLLRNPTIFNHLPNLLKKSLDRYEPELKNAKIIHFPHFGYRYAQALSKASPEQTSQIFVWGGQEFCQRIIRHGLGSADTIYGFNSCCLELFEYAKDRGIRCILDQTLADYSLSYQLLLEEEKRWPGWSLTPFQVNQADLTLMQREHREQDLADGIVCGSSFVMESLVAREVDLNKVTVVPLGRLKDGSQIQDCAVRQTPQIRGDGLKILFVGSVNLRKGIAYLLQALRQIKREIPFLCKAVGTVEIKPERIVEYSDICEFTGRILRSQIRDLYTWADVLVLPSICEGSAMVTYEALSLNLPIITTNNSGSVIRDGLDGFIIPIRDVAAIVEKLLLIYQTGNNFEIRANTQKYLNDLLKNSENQLRMVMTSQN